MIEALVALSILIVGIISGFILVTRALYDVAIIQDRLTASFLAQEGLEIVRQIRDTNYLNKLNGSNANWDKDLSNGDHLVSYDLSSGKFKLLDYQDQVLFYHPSPSDPFYGLYNYNNSGSAVTTTFKRKINITHISADEIRVQSIVTWSTRNISFGLNSGGIVAEDHLYNWLPH